MKCFKSLYEIRNRFLILSFVLTVANSAFGKEWNPIPTDHAAHFGLSSVAVEASMKSCQAWQGTEAISMSCRSWSSALILIAGIVKEASDKKNGGRFDQQDLAADALGIITGNLLQLTF